jgi:hypothetical protein
MLSMGTAMLSGGPVGTHLCIGLGYVGNSQAPTTRRRNMRLRSREDTEVVMVIWTPFYDPWPTFAVPSLLLI